MDTRRAVEDFIVIGRSSRSISEVCAIKCWVDKESEAGYSEEFQDGEALDTDDNRNKVR